MTREDLIKKLLDLSSQDIRLMCGEITAQEMRTVKAILNWLIDQLELVSDKK